MPALRMTVSTFFSSVNSTFLLLIVINPMIILPPTTRYELHQMRSQTDMRRT